MLKGQFMLPSNQMQLAAHPCHHVRLNSVASLPVRTIITIIFYFQISYQYFQFDFRTLDEKCGDPRPLLHSLIRIPQLFHLKCCHAHSFFLIQI